MTTQKLLDRGRSVRLAGLLIGLAAALAACTHTDDHVATASIPDDYRLRHPIAVEEALWMAAETLYT